MFYCLQINIKMHFCTGGLWILASDKTHRELLLKSTWNYNLLLWVRAQVTHSSFTHLMKMKLIIAFKTSRNHMWPCEPKHEFQHTLCVTFSHNTFLFQQKIILLLINFFSLFAFTPMFFQPLNAPASQNISSAAGTWRQSAEVNTRRWMELIRSIMQHNNHSIPRRGLQIQKTHCKTVEESELKGKTDVKIATYSWESLYGRQKKGFWCQFVLLCDCVAVV